MLSPTRKFQILFGVGFLLVVGIATAGIFDIVRQRRIDRQKHDDIRNGLTPAARTQFEQQKQEAEKKIKEEPERVIPYVDLAHAERGLGNIDAAIAALVRASDIAPTNYVILGNLATLYSEKGMNKEAEVAFDRALQNGSKEMQNYLQYADFLRYRFPKRRSDILSIYERGLKALNGDGTIRRALAGYYRDTGDDADALREWKAVLAREPNDAAVKQEIQETEARLKK